MYRNILLGFGPAQFLTYEALGKMRECGSAGVRERKRVKCGKTCGIFPALYPLIEVAKKQKALIDLFTVQFQLLCKLKIQDDLPTQLNSTQPEITDTGV